jgi:hypothetical protein
MANHTTPAPPLETARLCGANDEAHLRPRTHAERHRTSLPSTNRKKLGGRKPENIEHDIWRVVTA